MIESPNLVVGRLLRACLTSVALALAVGPAFALEPSAPTPLPVAAAPAPASPVLHRTGEPPLVPGDVLTIRVVTWDLVDDGPRDWPGAGGTVTVQGDDTIMVPFAGAVLAGGRAPADIADDISRDLRVATGVQALPAVTVEITQRRPVYVSGDVMTPGAIPFVSGLTVRQALALAGGPLRVLPQAGASTIGQQAQIREGLLRADLRIARLEAELAGADHFDLPDGIGDHPELASLVSIEQRLMTARRTSLQAQTASVDELISVLTRVRSGLQEQIGLVQADVERAEQNLARKQDLLDRGLTPATDVANAESSLSGQRMRLVDMNTQLLTVEKDLSEAHRTRDELAQKRDIDVLSDLGQVRDQRRDLELQQALLTPGFAATPGERATVSVRLIVEGSAEQVPVDPETTLWPGDTLVIDTGVS